MCNLYKARSSRAELARAFEADASEDYFDSEADIYPKAMAPVVRATNKQRVIELMCWGFPPPSGSKPVTNVRNLSTWRTALSNAERRCLVPATSFCEWEGEKGYKVQRWFDVPSQPVFAFAGIWRPIESGKAYAFLTCDPNPLVEAIHPKAMPVILQPDDYDGWLTGEPAEKFQHPFPSQLMRLHPIDTPTPA